MSAAERPGRDGGSFDRLRRFAGKRAVVERCDLCSKEVPAAHDHLLEVANRSLVCACTACALLFSGRDDARYKRVPRDVRLLPTFQITDAEWDGLRLPINLAFFFEHGDSGKVVACYPSPAGATESLLPLDAWEEIRAANPALRDMKADVEALLVNRIGHARDAAPPEYLIVPIDQCYHLVGLIRTHWKGLAGGNEVWREIARFFGGLRQRAHA